MATWSLAWVWGTGKGPHVRMARLYVTIDECTMTLM